MVAIWRGPVAPCHAAARRAARHQDRPAFTGQRELCHGLVEARVQQALPTRVLVRVGASGPQPILHAQQHHARQDAARAEQVVGGQQEPWQVRVLGQLDLACGGMSRQRALQRLLQWRDSE